MMVIVVVVARWNTPPLRKLLVALLSARAALERLIVFAERTLVGADILYVSCEVRRLPCTCIVHLACD
jgi:hypothetical protein